jgi:hypothetical protein
MMQVVKLPQERQKVFGTIKAFDDQFRIFDDMIRKSYIQYIGEDDYEAVDKKEETKEEPVVESKPVIIETDNGESKRSMYKLNKLDTSQVPEPELDNTPEIVEDEEEKSSDEDADLIEADVTAEQALQFEIVDDSDDEDDDKEDMPMLLQTFMEKLEKGEISSDDIKVIQK